MMAGVYRWPKMDDGPGVYLSFRFLHLVGEKGSE